MGHASQWEDIVEAGPSDTGNDFDVTPDLLATSQAVGDPVDLAITLDLNGYDAGGDPLANLAGGVDDGLGLAADLFDDISPDDPANLHFGFGPG